MNKASIGNNSTSSSNSSLDPLTTNLIGSSGSYPLTQKDVNKYMIAAIIATIVAVKSNFINEIWTIKSCLIINQVILLLILFVMRKRIKLVVQLFYEAGKAVQSMPLLLIQPIWVNNLSSFFIYCFFQHKLLLDLLDNCCGHCMLDSQPGVDWECRIPCGQYLNRVCYLWEECSAGIADCVPCVWITLATAIYDCLSTYGLSFSSLL